MAKYTNKKILGVIPNVKIVGRGGGAPGSNAKTDENRQSRAVAAAMTNELAKKGNPMLTKGAARTAGAVTEDRMSISANKYRERNRSGMRDKDI